MDNETTYIDEADVYVCNNCGAYAGSVGAIKHYGTCKKGESKHWEEHYNKEVDHGNSMDRRTGEDTPEGEERDRSCYEE